MLQTKNNFPSVEVMIPTFNSERTLKRCLDALLTQNYLGPFLVTLIDGGSTDQTCEIARRYNFNLIEKPGMYMNGKNGAYNFVVKKSEADLIWHIDSDNFVVENDALENLVKPFLVDPHLHISIPETMIDRNSSRLNIWLSAREIYNVNEIKRKSGRLKSDYFIIEDMPYGLTNGALVDRKALLSVGGFDSDVRVLARMRNSKLSRCAIVPKAHIYHQEASDIVTYRKKWVSRIRRFSSMSIEYLKDYYVQYPVKKADSAVLTENIQSIFLSSILLPLNKEIRESLGVKLFGIVELFVLLSIVMFHPVAFVKMYLKHF